MAINSIANLTDSTVAGSNTQIQYNNSGVFGASSNLTFDGSTLTATSDVVLAGTPELFINDTANADTTIGLTINQGANDDEVLAVKSSDIAHGITDFAETDTFGTLDKYSATDGGLQLSGYGETNTGLQICAFAATPDTTDTSTSNGALMLQANKKSGTGRTTLADTENMLQFNNGGSVCRLLLKGNGDMHITNTTLTALDDEDDIALIRAAQNSMSQGVGMAMDEWDEHLKASEDDLKRVGVLSSQGDFIIQQRYNSLVGGAIVQTYKKMMQLAQRIEDNVPALRGQLIPALGE